MRKEAYTIGSYVHIVKRGTRGLPIVRDERDRFRFLLMLTHLNDTFSSEHWGRDVYSQSKRRSLERPRHWPEKEPLVNVIAFCLVENHFHLILEEITEGGIARFMHRLGTAMAKQFNERYGEMGSLFQGAYRAKTISDDRYFRYVSAYVQVKNAFDMYPGGQKKARINFDHAYKWASEYSYSSLGDYTLDFDRPILQMDFLSSLFTPIEYKTFAKDIILGRYESDDVLQAHQSKFFT